MAKKKKCEKITINTYDILKKVRSPFSTAKMTGAGPHKSKKDFNRQAQKQSDKKIFSQYK